MDRDGAGVFGSCEPICFEHHVNSFLRRHRRIMVYLGNHGTSEGAMITHGNIVSTLERQPGLAMVEYDVMLPPADIPRPRVARRHPPTCDGSCLTSFSPAVSTCRGRNQLPNATVFFGVPIFYTRLLVHQSIAYGDHAVIHVGFCASLASDLCRVEATTATIVERYDDRDRPNRPTHC